MWFVNFFFFFKQKTAYEMRISDWSSDVCSSDLTAQGCADRLMLVLVAVLQRRHRGIGVAALAHDKFLERIIGAAGRWRAKDRDADRGKGGVHVLPRLRGVRLAIGGRGERLIDVCFGQLETGAARRFAQRDTVDADLDFDDVLDAIGLATDRKSTRLNSSH